MKTPTFIKVVLLQIIALMAGIFASTFLSAALPNPAQPVLVVQDSGAADRFQFFVPELLTTEGINGFQIAQLAELTAPFLANYDTVILPHLTLSTAQATLFQNYVNGGGTLVGFRPDVQLATVFGLTSLNTTLPEGWIQINTGTPQTYGLTRQTLRFHGIADRYSLNGAGALATLYETPTTATLSPAVATNVFGQGRAILFSFDLTESIVRLRQGNPAWAGYPNNHDGFLTMRASQMFTDNVTHTSWNDLGDQALNDVPQADVQLRLLSNAITVASAEKQRPLPRFWYFPNNARALLLLTGDQHGEAESNSTTETNAIASAGGSFTNFLWYPFGSVSASTVTGWLASGHALGIHFDDTAEADNNAGNGSHATWAGMQSVLTQATAAFAATYPNAPAPVTTRNHFLIWVSNNATGAPDPIAQARLFQQAGIKLDTSFSAFPNRWGYMNGSGLPLKFLDTTTGEIVQVYEQSTQYEDDVQLSGNSYSTNWNLPTAQTHYERSLSESLTKYNTVVTMLFHPDAWSIYSGYAQTVLQYAQTHEIPMPSAARWLAFWQSRAATGISNLTLSSNVLSFNTTSTPAGLTLLIPAVAGANTVSNVAVDGTSQSFTVDVYQGMRYANLTLAAGNHSVAVTYAPNSATVQIFGSVLPTTANSDVTVRIQGGTIDQTFALNADGSYAAGPLPTGTYTVTPISASHTFTPVSRTIVVGSSDVGDVSFTSSVAGGTSETLFTQQTPALTNLSDGPTTNYELGTAFSSAVAGTINAIRFWKTASEAGQHVGHIWSVTGQLLATVTFASETASGWQQQALDTSVAIVADTSYVVSVNTGNSYYVATNQGLATQVVNQDLRSVVGNNGVFGSVGAFPTSSYQSTNYFRDVVFSPTATPPPTGDSVFTTQTPALVNQSDGSTTNYELGTAFNSSVGGSISAIRFWKSVNETGPHVGHIWSPAGQLLASTAFANETASGWQQQSLTTPLVISANTNYLVSVNTGNTYYVATVQGLASQITNGDLRSVVGNNGAYGPVGAFPTSTYQNTNYFRDVVFNPTTIPPPTGESVFTMQTPAATNLSDGATVNYELGTAFSSSATGRVTALRFWKASNESGVHVGHLWSQSGQLLASVTFANETASGWQAQALDTPVAIAANTSYVVTVNTGNTYYVATNNALASPVTNQDLSTSVGNNGLYGPVGSLPVNSYQSTNYFRDVVFIRD